MSYTKKYSYSELRKIIYQRQYTRFPYLQDWKQSPYTWLKARYYIEGSALLVFFLLRTSVTANQVTVLYAASGLIGGIFLALPGNVSHLLAIIIFFNKSILDWSDGYIARLKYGPSITGDILDHYGAKLNSLGLSVGLGFYVFNRTGYDFLIYLIPLIPFFHAAMLTSFARGIILGYVISKNQAANAPEQKQKETEAQTDVLMEEDSEQRLYRRLPRLSQFFKSFLDDRARSVDFILLIVFLEMYITMNVSLLLFLALVLRWAAVCAGSFYVGVRSGWAESVLLSTQKRELCD